LIGNSDLLVLLVVDLEEIEEVVEEAMSTLLVSSSEDAGL
jgi:hypothetical protein